MKTNFVVYCWARTGSNHLVSLLNSLPDIVCHGEIFQDGAVHLSGWHRERMTHTTVEERDENPAEFLAELRHLNPRLHFGFKAFPGHIADRPDLRPIMTDPAWRKVFLYREPLAVFASLERAKKSGFWAQPANRPTKDAKQEPLPFLPDGYEMFCNRYLEFLTYIGRLHSNAPDTSVLISYEDLVAEPDSLQPAIALLDSRATAEEASSGFRKQSPHKRPENNFDDPEAALAYINQHDLTPKLREAMEALRDINASPVREAQAGR